LLRVMYGGVPSLQWRAAEVIGTCAQNNPEVQESFFRGGVMPPVWDLLNSVDEMCRLKALLAISCLVRGSPQLQGYFTEHGGTKKMLEMIRGNAGNGRIVRKCLQILNYVAQNPSAEDREQLEAASKEVESVLVDIVGATDDQDVDMAALEVAKSLGMQSLFQNVGTEFLVAH
jgi:hypothetical protein